MTTPKEDPIEELLFSVSNKNPLDHSIRSEWSSNIAECASRAAPAIRALQERVKLLEFELTESNRLLLLDLKQINALRAKIKRLMEAGWPLCNIVEEEFGDTRNKALEAWRKAVEEK